MLFRSVYQAEENDHSFQSHADRVWPAFKKWYNFSHRNKIVANQAQAYSFSLASPSCSVYQIRYRPGGCSNEHVRAFASATVTEVGIMVVPLQTNMEEALFCHGTASLCGRLLGYTRRRKMIIHSSRMRIESGRLLKNGTTFPTEIKSSPIKHKHI